MDQMGYVSNWHKRNTGSIKGASTLSKAGLSLLLTGFVLTFAVFFVVVLTAGLGQEFVDFAWRHFHGDEEVRGWLGAGERAKGRKGGAEPFGKDFSMGFDFNECIAWCLRCRYRSDKTGRVGAD